MLITKEDKLMKNTIKNTTSAYEKKLDMQEDLMKIIRQVRKQRASSVMELQKSNPALYEKFSAALYYFLMPASEGIKFMLFDQDAENKADQDIEKKFAGMQLSAYTSSLLASLQSMGMDPADIMSETWFWLMSKFTAKSKKNSGRLRIDVILDVDEEFVLANLYVTLNRHLLDVWKLNKKASYVDAIDLPVAGEDTLTLAELLSDDKQLMENASAYLRETGAFSKILESKLSDDEKLCMLLLGLGYAEMPKALKAFAQEMEISPVTLRIIVQASCPSLNLDNFPLEEALAKLSNSSTKRLSEIKRKAVHFIKKDEKLRQCLLA